MRNLVVNVRKKLLLSEAEGLNVDPETVVLSRSVCLTDDGPVFYHDGAVFNYEQRLADLKNVIAGEDVTNLACAGLVFLSDGNLVVALEAGLLLSVDLLGGGGDAQQVEVVGNLDAGLQGLWKSPDDELLVLASNDGAVILMTSRDFEALLEFNPEPVENGGGELANVNVGWGSKKTQFQGKIGKAAREAPAEASETVDASKDDLKIRVAWRDDGQYFAVSHVCGDQVRRIRVFSREGKLQSTSESVKKLGHSLAWKPCGGALIASSVTLNNGKDVVGFFEKNGLRHGEFSLPPSASSMLVDSLSWNSDSTILAVHCRAPAQVKDHLFLYVSSNYKWQLKQSWSYDGKIEILWDPISPMSLFVFQDIRCFKFDMSWKIHHSLGKSSSDLAFVGVVDGSVIKLTPFRQTVIPPPISAFEVHFDSMIANVMFVNNSNDNNASNKLAVITKSNEIVILDKKQENNSDSKVKVTGAGGQGFTVKCDLLNPGKTFSLNNCGRWLNWSWIDEKTAIASEESTLKIIDMIEGKVIDEIICEDVIHSTTSCGNTAAILMTNGTVLKLDQDREISPWFEIENHPTNVTKLELVNNDCLIALTDRQRLFVNGKEVANGVNSFFVHSDFLLATTVKHSLRCLPLKFLSKMITTATGVDAEAMWTNESVRSLERGSRLIISVSCDTRTVLQMPRGNLEVIHPRALALHILKTMLDDLAYAKAMEILRRQRINLNLIVDHNPNLFLTNVSSFLEQITDVNRICVFVADLMDEDTTKTMYKSMYLESKTSTITTKVDTVCYKMLTEMNKNPEKYILPIVSCLVKSSKSKVDDALLHIQSLKSKNEDLANDALNFLLLLTDVNRLFDVALGLYDFDLVLFVAEKSQKDPKEYLAILNEFKSLPTETYRRYKIDMYLKRYSSALNNIAQECPERLDECLALVKSQRLYQESLELFPDQPDCHKEVCRIYGDYLMAKRYYEDAAITYESGGLKLEAVDAWEKSPNWNYCLGLASDGIVNNQTEFIALCKRLVDKLREEKRPRDAAQILTEYMADPEEAVVVLLEGRVWSEAVRIINKHNRNDLIETNLRPALVEAGKETQVSVEKNAGVFHEQLARLLSVIEVKTKLAAGLFDEVDINVEDADLFSDTTSVMASLSGVPRSAAKSHAASLATRASSSNRSKSSKNRRKHEKKKYSTKEGSVFEDLGLIAALHDLVTVIYKSTEDVGPLTRCLARFGYRDQAKRLQLSLKTLLGDVKTNLDKIWDPSWSGGGVGGHPDPDGDGNKFGPEASTADIIERNAGETTVGKYTPQLSLLEPKYRMPPMKPPNDDWLLQTLM